MAFSLGEASAQAVLTYVSANQTAKLAAVAARHSDSILLPVFAALRLSDPNTNVEAEFPVLYVLPEEDIPSPSSAGLKRGFLLSTELLLVAAYELTIDQTGSGITEAETLRRMGARYAVALLEMLAEGHASMGYEFGLGVQTRIRYGATFTNKSRTTYLSDVRIQIGSQSTEAAL